MSISRTTNFCDVAVIGAGPSGLAFAKEALENGLQPTVFEKNETLGGVWTPEGTVWENMTTNLSHFTCRFSDFPWKEGTSDFPNQREVYAYLNEYADHFQLYQHLIFNAQVQKISRVHDKWAVEYCQHGETHTALFHQIVIASGVFSKAYIPTTPGLESFSGESIHSKDYYLPASFTDKQVVVIGNSYSGTEIASEVSQTAAKVTHVMRKPYWVIPRYLSNGKKELPLDLVFYNRSSSARSATLSPEEKNRQTHGWFSSINHQKDISKDLEVTQDPSSPYFVSISDTYLDRVSQGLITPKKGTIDHIEGSTLIFEDGTRQDADVIIWSTGYHSQLDFLEDSLKEELGYEPTNPFQPLLLDRCVFPLNLPNMAFVGMYRGPYFGTLELQAAWVAKVFSHKAPRPSFEERKQGIDEEQRIRNLSPRPQFPHSNYMGMMDQYGDLTGRTPNLANLKNEDPALYQELWEIAPLTPDQYQLHGEKREQALLQIRRVVERML